MEHYPYLRLMRLNQPVGIWLLLWPCWWSVALASDGLPPLHILVLFAIGAVFMRSAGCIVNDIADRKLDREVERTKSRPLASGELSVRQALILLFALLALSFLIALTLGPAVIMWAGLSLLPVVIYPFMKRISWWPQLFLGLTFNWGALVGWVAIHGTVECPAIFLYAGGVFWTLGYDTIYAHQDKTDDARIGIKSSALRLGNHTKPAVAAFYSLALICWNIAVFVEWRGFLSHAILLLTFFHFLWQLRVADLENPISCRRVFVSNIGLGLLVFIGTLPLL